MKHPYEIFGEGAMDKAAAAWNEMRCRLTWAEGQFRKAVSEKGFSPLFLIESVVLQIRLCCELYIISIASLRGMRLKGGDVLKIKPNLEKLFPDFGEAVSFSVAEALPIPEEKLGTEEILSIGGSDHSRILVVAGDSSLLRKGDIKRIFEYSGNALHAGGTVSYEFLATGKLSKIGDIENILKRMRRLCESQLTYFPELGVALIIRVLKPSGEHVCYAYDQHELLVISGKEGRSVEDFVAGLTSEFVPSGLSETSSSAPNN